MISMYRKKQILNYHIKDGYGAKKIIKVMKQRGEKPAPHTPSSTSRRLVYSPPHTYHIIATACIQHIFKPTHTRILNMSYLKILTATALLAANAMTISAQVEEAGNSFVHEHEANGYIAPDDPDVLRKLDEWQDLLRER